MSERDYNGWTNYETWNVKLWIDNDEGSQDYWRRVAEDALHYRHRRAPDEAISQVASQLRDEIIMAAPDLGASCYADLLNAAFSTVNWREIAESLVNSAKETLERSAK